jgi:hypothetical protein
VRSDFTSAIRGEDLGRTMLIACFPKSGSSLLRECLLAATGYGTLNLYFDGHQNEQEIHLPYIVDNEGAGSVAHPHCRTTISNINIIQLFQIDTVDLVRNILDSLMSIADFIGEGVGNIAFFPDDLPSWHRAEQLDAMVAK